MRFNNLIFKITGIYLCFALLPVITSGQERIHPDQVRLEGLMNSPMVEYAPSISADGQTMVFQSNRRGKYEIFIARKDKNGKWGIPEPIESINSYGTVNDLIGGPTLSFDGNNIYFFASFSGGVGIEDIYYSKRQGSNWSKPINAGRNINSRGYDGFPSLSSDGKSMFYVRRASNPSDPKLFCTQIMIAEKLQDGTWGKPEALPPYINTGCEKCPRILSDSETLMFSRLNPENDSGFDIYITRKSEDGTWSNPIPVDFINTNQDDLFASVPSSGDILYFNKELDGNFDLLTAPLPQEFRPKRVVDIQGVVKDSNGQPIEAYFDIIRGGKSQNNNSLNSNVDDGSYTMVLVEGYEYRILISSDGFEPIEIPFDFTNLDDYSLIQKDIQLEKIQRKFILQIKDIKRNIFVDAEFELEEGELPSMGHDSTGFYSLHMNFGEEYRFTIKKNGYSSVIKHLSLNMSTIDSIYQTIYLTPGIPKLILSVTEEETALPLSPTLDLRKSSGRRSVFSGIIRGGKYETELEYNQDFQIRLRLDGYFFYQDTINLKEIYDGRQVLREVKMTPLKTGNKLTLNNINFEINSATLSEDSKEILDEVALLLRQNRGLIIEIGAHSDDLGEELYNQALSEKRAGSVKEFMISKGVSERSLRIKGYGETSPLVPNDSDENRAKNRRVEFTIVKS